MWVKEFIKDHFNNKKSLIDKRYTSSKFMFILFSLLFFINFYLIWGKFYLEILELTIWYSYILLILSFLLYIYYFIKKMLLTKVPNYIFYIVIFILVILFLLLLLPIIFNGWINWLLELI